MENTRRSFAVSLAVSTLAVWIYFGCPIPGSGASSMVEGSFPNTLAKALVIPLTLAILGGGGLAAAHALGTTTDDAARRAAERRTLAATAPAAVAWLIFVTVMAFPLGPVGNAAVIAACALAVAHILRNVFLLGIFQRAPPSDCPQAGE